MDIDAEHIISPTGKLAIPARLREMNHFVEARWPVNGIEGLGEVRGDWRSRRERRTRPNDAINVVFGRQVGGKARANVSVRSRDKNALACHSRTLMFIGYLSQPTAPWGNSLLGTWNLHRLLMEVDSRSGMYAMELLIKAGRRGARLKVIAIEVLALRQRLVS
jgi:hypothetical protein